MTALRTIGRAITPLVKQSSCRKSPSIATTLKFVRQSSTFSSDLSSASKLSLLRPVTSSIIRPTQQQIRSLATAQDSKEYTVREALNEALAEELEADEKVFILGEEGE